MKLHSFRLDAAFSFTAEEMMTHYLFESSFSFMDAVKRYELINKRRFLKAQCKRESLLVADNSMEVLADFDCLYTED